LFLTTFPDCLNRWTSGAGAILVGFTGVGSDSAALVAHCSSREVGGTPKKQPEFTSKTDHTKWKKSYDPRSQGVYFRKLSWCQQRECIRGYNWRVREADFLQPVCLKLWVLLKMRVDSLLLQALFSVIIDLLGIEKQQAHSIIRKDNVSSIYIQGMYQYKPARKIIWTIFVIEI